MSQIDSQSRLADLMAGECFERVWTLFAKEAWWDEDNRNNDIDAAVNENMKEHTKPKEEKKPKKATGNSTMDRMIARAKGNEPPRKESGRKPANLPTETLRRLHAKVRKD
jgi:hypothetical protein